MGDAASGSTLDALLPSVEPPSQRMEGPDRDADEIVADLLHFTSRTGTEKRSARSKAYASHAPSEDIRRMLPTSSLLAQWAADPDSLSSEGRRTDIDVGSDATPIAKRALRSAVTVSAATGYKVTMENSDDKFVHISDQHSALSVMNMMQGPPGTVASAQAGSVKKKGKAQGYHLQLTHLLFALCSMSMCWALLSLLAPPPIGVNTGRVCGESGQETGTGFCICPRKTVCAKTWESLLFLVFSRASAYFDYPLYVCLFMTKARNLTDALQRSYISEFLPLEDLHHIHSLAGKIVSIEVLWHSFWHMLRWGLQGDIHLLWTHTTGISGMICLLLTGVIALPFSLQCLRRNISFEARKAMHYLSLVWAFALCFHAPTQHIAIVMGTTLAVYAVDYVFGFFMKVHHLHTLQMVRLGTSAVEVTFENPPNFEVDLSVSFGRAARPDG